MVSKELKPWTASQLLLQCGIQPLPHIRTRDHSVSKLCALLQPLVKNGLKSVLLITGDPPKVRKKETLTTTNAITTSAKGTDSNNTIITIPSKGTDLLTSISSPNITIPTKETDLLTDISTTNITIPSEGTDLITTISSPNLMIPSKGTEILTAISSPNLMIPSKGTDFPNIISTPNITIPTEGTDILTTISSPNIAINAVSSNPLTPIKPLSLSHTPILSTTPLLLNHSNPSSLSLTHSLTPINPINPISLTLTNPITPTPVIPITPTSTISDSGTDVLTAVTKVKKTYPSLRVYCGFDQYRSAMLDELTYCEQKRSAGCDGFFSQAFFSSSLLNAWAECELMSGLEFWAGLCPVTTKSFMSYWRNTNHAVFPRGYYLSLEYNVKVAKEMLDVCKRTGSHAYLMPVTVKSGEYLDALFGTRETKKECDFKGNKMPLRCLDNFVISKEL